MNKISINTHDYDGKLNHIYNKFNKHTNTPNINETILDITYYIKDPVVLKCLQLFKMNDNYDRVNNIDARDLLCEVWNLIDKDELSLFIDVMKEIINCGPCVQGRTTRLLQLYIMLNDQ